MTKRLVTYVEENGKKKVVSISAPINEDNIDINTLLGNDYGIIDGAYTNPPMIEGKKINMYYNDVAQTIEFEYIDIDFSDLSGPQQVKYLKEKVDTLNNANKVLQETNQNLTEELESIKAKNDNLKEELNLTQLALFDVVEATLA